MLRLPAWRHAAVRGASPPPRPPCLPLVPPGAQVKGHKACTISNAKGAAVLSTFGIEASRLTTWVVVLDCLYAAALLLALATLYRSMPRRIRQRASRAAGQRSDSLKQAHQPAPPVVASSV